LSVRLGVGARHGIDPEDRELFWFAETATEIWNGIRHWYDVFGIEIAPMP
jgi:hypothetical protein